MRIEISSGRRAFVIPESGLRQAAEHSASALRGAVSNTTMAQHFGGDSYFGGFIDVPEGSRLTIADSSWDGTGNDFDIAGPVEAECVYNGGPTTLARWEIEIPDDHPELARWKSREKKSD